MSRQADGAARSAREDLFSPISSGRISGLIVEQIRALIREGKLAPGDRLPSERDLAEQFGVSRVTVRDALRALEATGLVEIKVGAGGGAFLRPPSSDLIGQGMADMLLMSALTPEEVAEARLMLELNTVVLAVHRATEEDLEALRRICERSEELLRAGEYDVHLSWDFHERLAKATHNPAIELITRSFRGPLSMARARAREAANVAHARTVREHAELVAAIEARDVDRARAVLASHLVRATNLEERLGSMGIPGIPSRPPDRVGQRRARAGGSATRRRA
ncbi:MAG TPA: FadR/GntR family transcriptional regulator [Actinomycetota bacterium]|nr:FadR/GntR family transcriptional regulator [Actinomycetota bacterium]